MARILISNTYLEEVRGRLGVTADVLPDPQIDAPTVLPIAEAKVIARVAQFADYTNLTGDDASFLYAAAVSMVASLLAPTMTMRFKKSEGDADYKYENNSIDWSKRAADLEAEAFSYIDLIGGQASTDLNLMAASGPTRAGCRGARE